MLEALQELTRLAVQTSTGERSRLMLDIGGYRAGAASRADRAGPDGRPRRSGAPASRSSLDPMTPFERKVVHDAVAGGRPAQRVRGRGARARSSSSCPPDRARRHVTTRRWRFT